MPVVDVTTHLLAFLWTVYWPLFFVRARGIFFRTGLTKNNLIISVAIAIAISAVNVFFDFLNFTDMPVIALLMGSAALIPVALLVILGKSEKKRTQAKIMILAAYFHIFWQVLPGISASYILIDVAIALVLIALAKSWPRKRHKLQDNILSRGSISELWK